MRRRRRGETLGVLLGGAAAGAGLMYLLDPDRGRRRRALIRDQAVHLFAQRRRPAGPGEAGAEPAAGLAPAGIEAVSGGAAILEPPLAP